MSSSIFYSLYQFDTIAIMNPVQKKVETFFSQFPALSFSSKKIVLHPDDPITSIYYIKDGSVRMYAISEDGEEITLHVFQPTSFFPIMLDLNSTPNMYYFEANEQTNVFRAPTQNVITFLESEPDVLFDLTKRFAAGINGLLLRIEKYSTSDSKTKLVQLLLYLASKFGKKNENGIDIELTLRHEDIAHWTGTSRETVSRNLEKLAQQGVIHLQKNRITIRNISILQHSIQQ